MLSWKPILMELGFAVHNVKRYLWLVFLLNFLFGSRSIILVYNCVHVASNFFTPRSITIHCNPIKNSDHITECCIVCVGSYFMWAQFDIILSKFLQMNCFFFSIFFFSGMPFLFSFLSKLLINIHWPMVSFFKQN